MHFRLPRVSEPDFRIVRYFAFKHTAFPSCTSTIGVTRAGRLLHTRLDAPLWMLFDALTGLLRLHKLDKLHLQGCLWWMLSWLQICWGWLPPGLYESQVPGIHSCCLLQKHTSQVWGQCSHCFHIHCIMKWLGTQQTQHQCPMCRQEWKFKEWILHMKTEDLIMPRLFWNDF